jgi:hypothetical protein
MKRPRSDGGAAFHRKIAREIYKLAKVESDDKVKRLEAEIDDYKRDVEHFKDLTSGSLYGPEDYCPYCLHRIQEEVENGEEQNRECFMCGEYLPCETWCVTVRGLEQVCKCGNKPARK